MERVKLQAKVRDTSSKSQLKQLRRDGLVAGSVYGHGFDSVAISLALGDLATAAKAEGGIHALMEMSIEGAPKKASGIVVIKRLEKDPVSRRVLHVDFQRVLMTEKLTTETLIELTGTPVGLQLGGVLEHVMRSMYIRCLPDQIPSHIELDISGLDVGHALHVSDLPLPEGVEPVGQGDEVVVAVRQPTVHVEVAAEEGAPEAAAEQTAPAE